jgi:predicted ATP-dependent endonuclease of OLD family
LNTLINSLFEEEYNNAVTAINNLQEKITENENISNYNTKINQNFREIFPDLSLKITQKKEENIDIIKAFKTNHSIAVNKNGISRKETFEQHGHGIIRQALFNFLTFLKAETSSEKKDYIILFEEPELYLHPKSVYLLREQLYKLAENSPFQILCATHSPGMIDISKPHSSLVRVTKDPKTEETKTFQVGHSIFQDDVNKDFVQMINRFNPNVCEVFYSNEVLLVEGDTEALMFREVLNKYYPEKDIFVLNTGSKNNIPFFQKILSHFRIKQIIVHDSDTRYLYEKNGESYKRKKNKDGNDRLNSAWTINKNIWQEIVSSNLLEKGLARRLVFVYNFEDANGYVYDTSKGKPLSAYEFASNLKESSELQFMKFVKEIAGVKNESIQYTMQELEEISEPDEILEEV